MLFFFVIGFFLLNDGAFALSLGLGSCPSVTTEQSIDRKKLSGEWYLVETSKPSLEDLFVKCSTLNVSDPTDNGISRTRFSVVSTITEQRWNICGSVKQDLNACGGQKEGCAKFTAQTLGIRGPVWVLGTDYDSYVVFWSCRDFFIAHVSVVAVYTREQHPDQSVLDNAVNVLANSGLQNVTLTTFRQDCSE